MVTDPHPWAERLDTLLDQAWSRLLRGVHDRHAPARHPTLATHSPDGWPEARTVVLRAADRAAATLDLHTDLQSPKIAALTALPRAALHIWDASAHLQLRLRAEVTVLTGPATAALWDRVPPASRVSYGTTPPPGQPIPAALDYTTQPDPARFAVLRCHLLEMDLLHLGPRHRRARFSRAGGWAGTWLAP